MKVSLEPPFSDIVRVVLHQTPEVAEWSAYNNEGVLLMVLDREGMEHVANHPDRKLDLRLEYEDDPDGIRTMILNPETGIAVEWK